MNRVTEFEDAFFKRYGKKVRIFSDIKSKDGKVKEALVEIESRVGKYKIIEVFDDNAKTKYVKSGYETHLKQYKTYLEAEIYVADLIGEKENGST